MSKFIARIKRRQETYLQAIMPERVNIAKSCFYQSIALVAAFGKERRGRAYFQAGSASWRAVKPELDDGTSPTHYSYVYEGWSVLSTMLPEIHCWTVWLPSPGEEPIFIDPTVIYLPELAAKAGVAWSEEIPTGWLWKGQSELDDRYSYIADREATERAWAIGLNFLRNLE